MTAGLPLELDRHWPALSRSVTLESQAHGNATVLVHLKRLTEDELQGTYDQSYMRARFSVSNLRQAGVWPPQKFDRIRDADGNVWRLETPSMVWVNQTLQWVVVFVKGES